MASFWNKLGFVDNPYNPRPISADEDGERLLVGRSTELQEIINRLSSGGAHPTLEGQNGVGKTSLVTIALYKMFKEFKVGESTQAIIPMDEALQLASDATSAHFKKKVLYQVARGMINHHQLLKSRGYDVPDVADVDRWLNQPVANGKNFGISTPFGGGSVGVSTTFNTSNGFSEVGFETIVRDWLKNCFPTRSSGSFVFIIDNLEILETSQAARRMLEALRDDLLNTPGLSFVICGARGIMRNALSNRLTGLLSQPLEVLPLPDSEIPELVKARIEVYSLDDKPFVPVDVNRFEHLYSILNRNLRNAIKFAEDFSLHVAPQANNNLSEDDLNNKLEEWVKRSAGLYAEAASNITKTAWRVFDQLCKIGGSTSPGNHSDFGFESPQAMRPHLKALEVGNLIETIVDEDDNRRRSITVSSSGWLVAYKRSDFKAKGIDA